MHRLPLLRLSTLLTADAAEAEDLVQDVFVRAAGRIPELPDAEVRPYLRRSVINAWKNGLRARDVRARADRALQRGVTTPSSVLEDRDDLWTEILKLPSRQRACVVLRYYEDMADADIADVLGCRVGTVRSQSSRALDKLRKSVTP